MYRHEFQVVVKSCSEDENHSNMKNIMTQLEYNQWSSQKKHRTDFYKNFKNKKKWIWFKTYKRTECEQTGWHALLKIVSHDVLQESSYTKQQYKVAHEVQNYHDLVEKNEV